MKKNCNGIIRKQYIQKGRAENGSSFFLNYCILSKENNHIQYVCPKAQ